ncbi:MAG: hypothetical protein A2X64_05965 [Ignavibacteria bacterium GWF2_33_9]|nr:MAG: hypothetical protein A2X64_05965 [Ignavibacteria bacterium GWF2_33_9]
MGFLKSKINTLRKTKKFTIVQNNNPGFTVSNFSIKIYLFSYYQIYILQKLFVWNFFGKRIKFQRKNHLFSNLSEAAKKQPHIKSKKFNK